MEHTCNSEEKGSASNIGKDLKCFLSSCLSFSCEGNALLDDENVPCLEPTPDYEAQEKVIPISCRVQDTQAFESVQCSSQSSGGLIPFAGPADSFFVQGTACVDPGKDNLYYDMKKQLYRNYDSCASSPTDANCEIVQFATSSEYSVNWPEELTPLISRHHRGNENENTEFEKNEVSFVIKKEIYNKILPFPILEKMLGSHESSGAIHSVVEYDSNTKCHSVMINSQKARKNIESSALVTSAKAKDTMILCNNLDNACQVVPLAFRPNLFPDKGSVPVVSDGIRVSNSDTTEGLVGTSCTMNSPKCYPSQPASWPRRRPQSLRVALCYSDPDCLQSTTDIRHQEMDITGVQVSKLKNDRIAELSSTTSFTQSFTKQKNKDEQKKHSDFSNLSTFKISGNEDVGKRMHDEDREENLHACRHSKAELLSENNAQQSHNSTLHELPVMSWLPVNVLQGQKSQHQPCTNEDCRHCLIKCSDNALVSPSSDKENDPVLLSVRPKVIHSQGLHSPKKKSASPKRKHKSPRKSKSVVSKDCHSTSSQPLKLDWKNTRNEKNKDESQDVWAVDDFLPVSKASQINCKHQKLPSCRDSASETPVCSPSTVEDPSSRTVKEKNAATPNFEDMDSSMITSTFSTDTGYETETTTSSTTNGDTPGSKVQNLFQARKIVPHQSSPCDASKGGSHFKKSQSFQELQSKVTTVTDPTFHQNVICDTSEYSNMCNELAHLIRSSLNISSSNHVDEAVPQTSSERSEVPNLTSWPKGNVATDMSNNMLSFDMDDDLPANSRRPDEIKDDKKNMNISSDEEVVGISDIPDGQHCPPSPEEAAGEISIPSSSPSAAATPSQELVEVKYMQLSLSIVLAIVLHAMQSISQLMFEVFLTTDQDDPWDKM